MNKLHDLGIYEKLVCDSGSRPPLPGPVKRVVEINPTNYQLEGYKINEPFSTLLIYWRIMGMADIVCPQNITVALKTLFHGQLFIF